MISLFDRIENIVWKEKMLVYLHFLCFPECFQKGILYRVIKSHDFVVKS